MFVDRQILVAPFRGSLFMKRIFALVAALVLLVPPLSVGAADPTGPTVIINELMWMGSSVSAFDEWLELRNLTDQPIDLSGWYLTRKASGVETLMLTLPADSVIEANGLFVISNYAASSTSSALLDEPDVVDSAVSLANTQLQIKLYAPDNVIQDIADDGSGAPLKGGYVSGSAWASMERNYTVSDGTLAGSWHTATSAVGFKPGPELGTPGLANSNSAPIAVAGADQTTYANDVTTFDGTESSDPDGDALTYAWDFGDGSTGAGPTPTHVYSVTGAYAVFLAVSDGQLSATDTLQVTVKQHTAPVYTADTDPLYDPDHQQHFVGTTNPLAHITLSEILPNPMGLDKEGEFIELYNAEAKDISLKDWRLVIDAKSYSFPDVVIRSQDFLAVGYATTKLTLTNAGATIELQNPKIVSMDSVTYTEGAEGQSFAKVGGDWVWTTEPTPGEENVQVASGQEVIQEENAIVSIGEVRTLDQRTKVTTQGVVAVAPEVFGAQYFYIFDGEAGIKIYSSKKDFPKLSEGDAVTVSGAVGFAEGEQKINVSSADAIVVTGHDALPESISVAVGEITDDVVGALVRIEGVADTVTKTQFTVTDAHEIAAVAIKKGTNIGAPEFTNGTALTVVGIVGIKNDAPTIFPRSIDDIIVAGDVLGATTDVVFGNTATMSLASRPPITKNLIITLGALLMGVTGFWYWYKKRAQARGMGYSKSLKVKGEDLA